VKIPSEAELIEIERRTLCLPGILEYLERRADNLDARIEMTDNQAEEMVLRSEYRRVERAIRDIERLQGDIETLVELVRAGAVQA
jgi:prefoldin subunit 5